ncbi:hypothetical protein J3R30DRAFT_763873 [Lentinula aciculospora]|uniref:Uncharacterized protein n=1 Tax=Lentinula aciculospora TaxID=153920 RepID=A0A9W9A584_9AGAR|nr:hypothetical protein J3R30DRAFT_763873 [Lentinula aciculospora]
MKMDVASNSAMPAFFDEIDSETQEQPSQPESLGNSDSTAPVALTLESNVVEYPSAREESGSFDPEEPESISPPSSASASILSMPDPLSSSNTSVLYDTIHISDYASILEYGSGVSSPSVAAPGIDAAVDSPEYARRLVNEHYHTSAPSLQPELDHSDHEFGSESEPDSESSFPSVTSSFFFSSPASVASHGPYDDSHGEFNEDGESRGLRATQELVIPSLTLPEALDLPNHFPLETPHPPKLHTDPFQAHNVPSTSNPFRLLVVAPSDSRRTSKAGGDRSASLSERVMKDLEDEISQANALHHLRSFAPPDQDMEAVLETIIDSFFDNELFAAVVLASEIPNDAVSSIKQEIAQFSEALSPLVPVIYLLSAHTITTPDKESTSQSTATRLSSSLQNSPLIPTASLSVSSVQELHKLLTRPDVYQRLHTEAVEKFMKWMTRKQKVEENTRLDDAPISIPNRHARTRRGYGDNNIAPRPIIEDVVVSSSINSEGSWRQFKAQWEASWENAYSLQRQEYPSREDDSQPDSEEELLRIARIRLADTSSVPSGTLKGRRQSRIRKSYLARPQSSSSSSPLPATSPSLPPSSALPSTMPSSLSLPDSLFMSADEIPDMSPLPPIPLVVTFPFPSSTISLLHPSSRNPSRARSRGTASRSRSPYYASEKFTTDSTPFLLDLHAGRFDPLQVPSFLALSLSILAPLRAHMWSATRRIFSVPSRVAGYLSIPGEFRDGLKEDQSADDKLVDSIDFVETVNDDKSNTNSSPSSSFQFRRGLWPTGVMLVSGFLLGFAVGYMRGL